MFNIDLFGGIVVMFLNKNSRSGSQEIYVTILIKIDFIENITNISASQ